MDSRINYQDDDTKMCFIQFIVSQVHNCDVTNEVAVPKPLLDTQEPICPPEQTACADGTCIETALFCDGHPDCYDESGILNISFAHF